MTDRRLHLEIWHDPDVESPCEDESQWRLYSFNVRHLSYRDPECFLPPDIGLRRKLAVGTAHLLSYFEHSLCVWMLHDSPKDRFFGDWRWDGVDIAGILVWEDPVSELGLKSKEERAECAAQFLEIYTQWCNGETLGYTITDTASDEIVGDCGFYIGLNNVLEAVFAEIDDSDVFVSVSSKYGIDLERVENKRREYYARDLASA